jgi:hypothetical protein
VPKRSKLILIKEARQILYDLGLPPSLQGETPIYVFLTLMGVSPTQDWNQATNLLWRITPLMQEIERQGFASFKPNTRENIRDECVGILVDAYLITPNPDQPSRSKNSPHYCYQINTEVVDLVKTFKTPSYQQNLQSFLASYTTLQQRYASERNLQKIKVILPNGNEALLSPGGQNPLIA